MNGRLYDPVLHRFLAPDNYVQDPFNTQNFNRYGYVLNNPLSYTDPSGEFSLRGVLKIIIHADFPFKMTNNAWTGGDKYRTAALEVGIGEYSVGWSLFTTQPNEEELKALIGKDENWTSPIWRTNKGGRHTYETASRVYSGFYFGFKAFGRNYRAGHDGALVAGFISKRNSQTPCG